MLLLHWREKGNRLALDTLFVFCIFSIYAGSITPEVNESHYWVKAAHFWNPEFAHRDMFLQSKDAHWFFFASIGVLTDTLSLPVATWIGRLLGWLCMGFAWSLLASRFSTFQLAGTLSAGCWVAAMHSGHLSGEWVIGGCEAKVFAYAAALIGLSFALDRAYGKGWIWMGIASAFHVLTGAWLVIATIFLIVLERGIGFSLVRPGVGQGDGTGGESNPHALEGNALTASTSTDTHSRRYRRQRIGDWFGLFFGGAISLLGLWPALILNTGVSPTIQDQGAITYVFQRLPHHLVPTQFASARWISFAILLTVCVVGVFWTYKLMRKGQQATFKKTPDSEALVGDSEGAANLSGAYSHMEGLPGRYLRLITIAIIFIIVAGIGLLIDLLLSSWATNWSASLLRYYWFRWNDVIWPTVLCLTLLTVLNQRERLTALGRFFVVAALVAPAVFVIGGQYTKHFFDSISPADQASLLLRNESPAAREQIHRDWLDICSFIRSNTPSDALFLTPRFQQTFKWHACRAEVVCWKDSPQDAIGLIEWESRLLKVFPRGEDGYGVPWSDELLNRLDSEYHFDYVLIDRRIQKTPPVLEFIQSNSTYALFRMIKLKG